MASLHYLALRELYMHPASSHRRRYNIVRESELDFCHLPNKYIFYLRTQKLGTSLASVHEITSPQCSTTNFPTYIGKKKCLHISEVDIMIIVKLGIRLSQPLRFVI